MDERLSSLKTKHNTLEERIYTEESRPRPDDQLLHHLKREKLAIKDEIAQIQRA